VNKTQKHQQNAANTEHKAVVKFDLTPKIIVDPSDDNVPNSEIKNSEIAL
jgi:hypothetical protein